MTYETKADLRRQVEDLERDLRDADRRACNYYALYLEAIGTKRYTGKDLEVAAATATDKALTLVIEALDLKEYKRPIIERTSNSFTMFATVSDPAAPKASELTPYDTARFEKDLRTALDVREERAAQARRVATEKKVAGLAKTTTIVSADQADPSRRLREALSKFAAGGYTTRPDKTVDETLDGASDAKRKD